MIKVFSENGLDFYCDINLNNFKVSSHNLGADYSYACYFNVDTQIIKLHYQQSPYFEISIDFSKIRTLSIRFFIRDESSKEIFSRTIEITEYLEAIRLYLIFIQNKLTKFLLCKSCQLIIQDKINFEKGQSFIKDKQLKLATFSAVQWSTWENWEVDPLANRSWQWALHRFEFNKSLLSYHYQTKDNTVLDELGAAFSSWMDNFAFDYEGDFEFIWHDHATALRVEQLLIFIFYLLTYEKKWLDNHIALVIRLIKYIYQATDKLSHEDFYSKHTNHGLEQVRVLLIVALVLERTTWQKVAVERLKDELSYSFTSEGVHKENSPGYHQFVFKIFISIIDTFPPYVLGSLEKEFQVFANKALEHITYILRPDNKLPIIGDTELKTTTNAYGVFFSNTLEYENFLYSFTQGVKGIKPVKINKVYPKSGYAIFRNDWGKVDNFKDSIQIIFKAGCLSRYHHQQDENHFVIYGFGEDWIIDSGLYNYIDQDPIRYYARRRQAHNVPLVSNSDYDHNNFEHRIRNWKIYNYSEDNVKPYVSAKNTVLQDVEHDRVLSFDGIKHEIIVTDRVTYLNNKARDVVFLLHLPMDKKIDIFDNCITVNSSKQNKKMMITLEQKPNNIEIKSGIKGKTVNSVVSNIANTYEDSQVIRLIFEKSANIECKFKMSFLEI